MTSDRKTLEFIRDRLIFVHHENPDYDYLHKLQSIIEATPHTRNTPNTASIDLKAILGHE